MTINDLVFNLTTINNLNPPGRKRVADLAAKFIGTAVTTSKQYPHFWPLAELVHLFNEDKPLNCQVIDGPDYYRLPCGRYLEDYIAYCDLDFATGSALKYAWRAGKKDGESRDKDWSKVRHYAEFIAARNGATADEVIAAVETYRHGAEIWDGIEVGA